MLQAIEADPTVSAARLAESFGITERAVEKHIASLKKMGWIDRTGPDKGGIWVIIRE